MKFRSLFLLTLLSLSCLAQKTILGRVEDKKTGIGIPFASVGIVGTSKGTVTNIEGQFSLVADRQPLSVKITCVGYENAVIEDLDENSVIRLIPGNIQLNEVIVSGRDLNGRSIVRRAFRKIGRNYETKDFKQSFFYRHYCKDDTVYGRLIEGAVEVWKKKGYKLQRPRPEYKEDMRVVQLRRSFDATRLSNIHMPIALNSVLGTDVVGYQAKTTNYFESALLRISKLKTHNKYFEFSVRGITMFDGKEVYEVYYEAKPSSANPILPLKISTSGTLFITTASSAIVKAEQTLLSPFDTIQTTALYREFEGKYYPYHFVKDGRDFVNAFKMKHRFHIELMSTEISKKNFEKFKGKEPDKEMLFNLPFDSTFWNSYNIVKTTPLEDSIISQLGGNRSLNAQFAEYNKVEAPQYFDAKEGERGFYQHIDQVKHKQVVFVDFWASWCKPCIQEMVPQKKLLEQYAGKVSFVLVSIDLKDQAWKNALEKYDLKVQGFSHFRIGQESDAAKLYSLDTIPRYVLIRRNGEHFSLRAKKPSNPGLKKDLDFLINEGREGRQ